jgi:hypothetical protein
MPQCARPSWGNGRGRTAVELERREEGYMERSQYVRTVQPNLVYEAKECRSKVW